MGRECIRARSNCSVCVNGNISQTQTPLALFAGLSQSFFFPAAANSQPRFAEHIPRHYILDT